MKKADKEMRRLLWLIDFVNLDIDRLTFPDFTKLALEINEKIEPEILVVYEGEIPAYEIGEYAANLKKIRDAQGKEHFDWQLNQKSRQYAEITERIKTIQERIRKVFDAIYELKKPVPKKVKVPEPALQFEMTIIVQGWSGNFFVGPGPDFFPYALEYEVAELIYHCSPERAPHQMLRSLANLKKCQLPTCQKFLWQVHKKEKNYCSNKCAWRAFAAFRRAVERKDKEEQKGGI